jgi:HlyD family secretion protein
MPQESEYIQHQPLYETRSEEVQEIMGRMPSWLVRYGVILIGVVLCLLLSGSYFIKFPDKISANVSITSDNPPVKIISERGGRIKNIYVKQNDSVSKDAVLLELDSKANLDDIKSLRDIVVNQLNYSKGNYTLFPTPNFELGDLQKPYDELQSSIAEWKFFLQHDNSYIGIEQLEKQIADNIQLNNQLIQKEKKIKENSSIDLKLYETDRKLYNKKAITESDYLTSKKRWIDQQMNLDNNKNTIVTNTLKQSELRKNIFDIKQEKQKMLFEYKRKVELSMKSLLLQLDEWEKAYIIKSPVAGRVNLYSIWKENQYIQSGQSILLIVPSFQHIVAHGVFPISSSGKAKVGQPILINLVSHPQHEYGYLEGEISFIATAPLDSIYSFDIRLKNGLKTSTNQIIFPQPQMYGMGEILTDDKNMMVRIVEKLNK